MWYNAGVTWFNIMVSIIGFIFPEWAKERALQRLAAGIANANVDQGVLQRFFASYLYRVNRRPWRRFTSLPGSKKVIPFDRLDLCPNSADVNVAALLWPAGFDLEGFLALDFFYSREESVRLAWEGALGVSVICPSANCGSSGGDCLRCTQTQGAYCGI